MFLPAQGNMLPSKLEKCPRLHDGWSDWLRETCAEFCVDKKPHFEIDLQVEGVSQDAILQDEEQMKEINNKLEKLFVMIWRKKRGNMIFSEESRRAIYEMGNLELIELRQASATIQCLSCLKHVPEIETCVCVSSGFDPIKIRWTESEQHLQCWNTVLSYSSNSVTRKKHGHDQWQMDHAEAVDAKRGVRRRGNHASILSRWQNDET